MTPVNAVFERIYFKFCSIMLVLFKSLYFQYVIMQPLVKGQQGQCHTCQNFVTKLYGLLQFCKGWSCIYWKRRTDLFWRFKGQYMMQKIQESFISRPVKNPHCLFMKFDG